MPYFVFFGFQNNKKFGALTLITSDVFLHNNGPSLVKFLISAKE